MLKIQKQEDGRVLKIFVPKKFTFQLQQSLFLYKIA